MRAWLFAEALFYASMFAALLTWFSTRNGDIQTVILTMVPFGIVALPLALLGAAPLRRCIQRVRPAPKVSGLDKQEEAKEQGLALFT